MAENKKIENPKPDEKVCFNCKNMLWMVGIGQGVKCKLDFKISFSKLEEINLDKFE